MGRSETTGLDTSADSSTSFYCVTKYRVMDLVRRSVQSTAAQGGGVILYCVYLCYPFLVVSSVVPTALVLTPRYLSCRNTSQ